MTPVKFDGYNAELAKDQPQFQTLPVFIDTTIVEKPMISCWQLSCKERFKLFFTGRLWLSQFTYGNKFQPILPTVNESDVLVRNEEPSHNDRSSSIRPEKD